MADELKKNKATQRVTLADLINLANDAYGDDLVSSYHNYPEGEHGDTLAEFIVREIKDTYEKGQSAQVILDEAARVMDKAVRDVASVRDAFEAETVLDLSTPMTPHTQGPERQARRDAGV